MTGDYSRWSHDPRKDDAAVLLQQGRILTDADWNLATATAGRRTQAGTLDVVGRSGVPLETPDGFRITLSGGGLSIGPGRAYVDGILAENHGAPADVWTPTLEELTGTGPVPYTAQPHLPQPPPLPTSGAYLVYVKVWRREVTAVDDPSLIEPALGIDTTTRHRTIWQVKAVGLPAGYVPGAPFADQPWFLAAEPPATARLTVGTATVETDPDPCLISPTGGYTGVENQLYRVQVHTPGPAGTATFTWSRDNATVAARVISVPSTLDRVTVDRLGQDRVLSFHEGEWVELLDEARELSGQRGVLRRIKTPGGIDEDTGTVVFTAALGAGDFALDAQGRPVAGSNLRICRWDQGGTLLDDAGNPVADPALAQGSITIPADGTRLVLEHGITVGFSADPAGGAFRTGDHWLIPARTADPTGHEVASQPALGIHAHYAGLAVVDAGDVTDVRPVFPPLSGLDSLFYVAGDGQEVTPDTLAPTPVPLPVPPTVGVSRGPVPVPGRPVIFTLSAGGSGTIDGGAGPVTVPTGPDGTASVAWAVDPVVSQTLEARLLDASGTPSGLPVFFSARTRLASRVAYQPGACASLAGVATVQDALDKLCLRDGDSTDCCASVGEGGDYPTLEEALRDLAEQRDGRVCLCLLPGEHEWEGSDIDYVGHLDVHGCGAQLVLHTPFRVVKCGSVELSALDVVGSEQLEEEMVRFTSCGQVSCRDLRLFTRSQTLPVLVHLSGCAGTRIRDCEMTASRLPGDDDGRRFTGPTRALLMAAREGDLAAVRRVAAGNRRAATARREAAAGQLEEFARSPEGAAAPRLVATAVRAAQLLRTGGEPDDFVALVPELADLAVHVDATVGLLRAALAVESPTGPVWITGNDLVGGVSLYGVASPERIGELEQDLDALVSGAQNPPHVDTGAARLDLHQNRLAWTLVAQEREEIAFESVRAGDNVVDGGPLELLAGRASVSDNHLGGSGRLAGLVQANKASATGNIGSAPESLLVLSASSRAGAANVDLSVVP